MPPRAIVFAAGFGKRMQPITLSIPKPMIEVAGRSMINRALDQLLAAGVETVVVNTHHLAGLLQQHVFERPDGPEILISHEVDILETGGGIVKALPLLGPSSFITYNGDIILVDGAEPALHRLAKAWDPTRMDALMLLHPVDKAVGYDGKGDFALTKDSRICKPKLDNFPYVFTGIMIIKSEIFQGLKEVPFSVYRDFLHPRYIQPDGSLSRVYGMIHDGGWLHIGTPEGIVLAETALAHELG